MVPPWTPPPPQGDDAAPPDTEPQGDDTAPTEPPAQPPQPPLAPAPVAPARRFHAARTALGDYARSGDRSSLHRSVGHYVRKGYGGSSTATRRFGSTAATAAALADYLARSAARGRDADTPLANSSSAREIIRDIVEAVRPIDGTLDAEANRAAISDALAELLTQYPDADPLHLDPQQQTFVVEHFTALDVCRRFMLDLGRTITEKAPSASTAAARIAEAQGFIKESVAASFRKLREAGRALTGGSVARLVRDALRATFIVFEEYAV
jgi:hypothetical protein